MDREDILRVLKRDTKGLIEEAVLSMADEYRNIVVEVDLQTHSIMGDADSYIKQEGNSELVSVTLKDKFDILKKSYAMVVYQSKELDSNIIKKVYVDLCYVFEKNMMRLYTAAIIDAVSSQPIVSDWVRYLDYVPSVRDFNKFIDSVDNSNINLGTLNYISQTIDSAYCVFKELKSDMQ